MQTFNDVEAFTRAWDTFEQSHCPYRNEKHISKTHHYKVLLIAVRIEGVETPVLT